MGTGSSHGTVPVIHLEFLPQCKVEVFVYAQGVTVCFKLASLRKSTFLLYPNQQHAVLLPRPPLNDLMIPN